MVKAKKALFIIGFIKCLSMTIIFSLSAICCYSFAFFLFGHRIFGREDSFNIAITLVVFSVLFAVWFIFSLLSFIFTCRAKKKSIKKVYILCMVFNLIFGSYCSVIASIFGLIILKRNNQAIRKAGDIRKNEKLKENPYVAIEENNNIEKPTEVEVEI